MVDATDTKSGYQEDVTDILQWSSRHFLVSKGFGTGLGLMEKKKVPIQPKNSYFPPA